MSRVAGIDWRGRAWLIYLGVGLVLTAAYLWFPPLKGNGPLINLLGLSSSVAVALGIYFHRPKAWAAWALFIVGLFLFFVAFLITFGFIRTSTSQRTRRTLADILQSCRRERW